MRNDDVPSQATPPATINVTSPRTIAYSTAECPRRCVWILCRGSLSISARLLAGQVLNHHCIQVDTLCVGRSNLMPFAIGTRSQPMEARVAIKPVLTVARRKGCGANSRFTSRRVSWDGPRACRLVSIACPSRGLGSGLRAPGGDTLTSVNRHVKITSMSRRCGVMNTLRSVMRIRYASHNKPFAVWFRMGCAACGRCGLGRLRQGARCERSAAGPGFSQAPTIGHCRAVGPRHNGVHRAD